MKNTIFTLMAILATTQTFAWETPGEKYYGGKITQEEYFEALGIPKPPVKVIIVR